MRKIPALTAFLVLLLGTWSVAFASERTGEWEFEKERTQPVRHRHHRHDHHPQQHCEPVLPFNPPPPSGFVFGDLFFAFTLTQNLEPRWDDDDDGDEDGGDF